MGIGELPLICQPTQQRMQLATRTREGHRKHYVAATGYKTGRRYSLRWGLALSLHHAEKPQQALGHLEQLLQKTVTDHSTRELVPAY